ncbi:MAG: hypothetical protein IJW32_05510 [Clostridia bacterium]|nr:hypothetical protein [Clostridia bacterium]
MGLYFYNYCGVHKLKKFLSSFSDIKNNLFIIGFSGQSPMFLRGDYYKLLKELKKISQKENCEFLMCFYIKQVRHYLNALHIKNGKIANIIGESFTNKNLIIKGKTNILILFYFELYDSKIRQRIDFGNIDLTVGIDNEKIDNNIVFLDNKFFNKLVLLGENSEVRSKNKENILKIEENLVKYNVQNFTKLIK